MPALSPAASATSAETAAAVAPAAPVVTAAAADPASTTRTEPAAPDAVLDGAIRAIAAGDTAGLAPDIITRAAIQPSPRAPRPCCR